MKLFRHIVALSLVAVVTLTSCAGATKDTLTRVRKDGKLIIGTSADYPPYEFHAVDASGNDIIVGFDIAIAKEIAKDLGVELVIKDMSFDGLLAALAAGTIDIVISGMTPTEERKQSVDFSDTYYYAIHGIMVRAADVAKFDTVESFKDAQLSAQKGTIQVGIAKSQILGVAEEDMDKPHSQIKEVGTIKNLVLDLKNSKVDAIVAELPVAQAYVSNNPDLALAKPTFSDDDGGSAIAVRKGNEAFVAEINKTLKRLMDNELIEKFVAEANELVEN